MITMKNEELSVTQRAHITGVFERDPDMKII